MDFMEEAVDLILLYEVKVLPTGAGQPGRGAPALRRADRRGDAEAAVDEVLEEYWIEINRLENAGDKFYRASSPSCSTASTRRIEVMKLKDIVEALEEAIDAFENVANIVEQIAVKES